MIKQGATNLLFKVIGGLLIVAVNAVCARALSPETYGHLVSILSFCALCGGLAALGSDHFFKRYFGSHAGVRVQNALVIYPWLLAAVVVCVAVPLLPVIRTSDRHFPCLDLE